MKIKRHKLYIGSEPVPYRRTPNVSSTFNPEGIVLHDTAGRLDKDSSVNWLTSKAAKASAHFVIERDSSITQLAPLNVATWHAGRSAWKGRTGCNRFAFGIEIVNPGFLTKTSRGYRAWFKKTYKDDEYDIIRKSTPEHGDHYWMDYTPEQIEAVIELCMALKVAYPIKWIATHWQVSPGRKIDTNPLFPLDHVKSRVFGRFADEDDAGNYAEITTDANMRKWPSFADNVIKIIPAFTRVEVIRTGIYKNGDEEARWYLVSGGDDEGWVHGSLIEVEQ